MIPLYTIAMIAREHGIYYKTLSKRFQRAFPYRNFKSEPLNAEEYEFLLHNTNIFDVPKKKKDSE